MFFSKLSKLFSSPTILTVAGSALLASAGLINLRISKPEIIVSKQDEAINVNKDLLRLMSFGNKRLITDLIWIQTLIESDVEHYRKRDLNNWLYLRFLTIATLDPKFYENYLYGGQFLGIVKDDLEGAKQIYDKGLAVYPDDYSLNYFAGFLNYYEIGDFKTGIKYLEKIQHHPKAPVFIESIVNKLKYEVNGDKKVAMQFLHDHYEKTEDKTLKKKLLGDLYSLKAEIDLECLNGGGKQCDTKDLYGDSYILSSGKYQAQRPYLPYKLFRNKK